ncbi:hypothetical protein [Amycolatopsis sp. Poz14]|uniref:hypothetical protein n=1 Tax=Amycolatopsis sp. Poz14 TaxID=1447705 RepID=UPI001EE7FAF0|nr:hypothetical protein [Amycolatopsis sp. Poz14]MCG3756688.1 hypothetical protein [Amycolatopsis sp. Poz14]
MEEKPVKRSKPNPVYAWIGQKRKAAARRLADYHRLTAEADAMEADLRYEPDADQPAPGGEE